MKINYQLDIGAYVPEKAHDADAGFDLRTPCEIPVPANGYAIIDTGVHVEIPYGYVGFLKSKSGLNVKHNLQCEGVIDSGYTGSIVAKINNHGTEDYTFNAGDKVTQLVILPIPEVEMVRVDEINNDTERGDNGFGSSGK